MVYAPNSPKALHRGRGKLLETTPCLLAVPLALAVVALAVHWAMSLI